MDNLSRVEAIFFSALDKPSCDRARFLDEACGGDLALRGEVERMLAAHPKVGDFLAAPVGTVDQPTTETAGTRIGPYKLLQQIGEGGMGVVWMAEQQEPVRRMVALKIIKPGMDSAQVIARFEAERQALAMMDHINIARVLDAGTTGEPGASATGGRPFFVMELVHGIPIAKYCDDNKLTPRQRLELFIPVCRAIQHAHQKGIIHRDIKPSNVLVTMYDDKPVPKVIDFGVAKAIDQRLTERTLFTHYGALVGTFEYMSPEQAEMNALGVDTRSDIYALGVLLYELLTGTTPLQRDRVRQAGLHELVRLIREEEPPQPSVRLSSSDTLAKIAAARGTELPGEGSHAPLRHCQRPGPRHRTLPGRRADRSQPAQRDLPAAKVHATKPGSRFQRRRHCRGAVDRYRRRDLAGGPSHERRSGRKQGERGRPKAGK
jgi:serine/threonine protein kinase